MDCFRIFQILHISFNTPRTYIVIIFFFGFFDFILFVPPRSFHSLFSSKQNWQAGGHGVPHNPPGQGWLDGLPQAQSANPRGVRAGLVARTWGNPFGPTDGSVTGDFHPNLYCSQSPAPGTSTHGCWTGTSDAACPKASSSSPCKPTPSPGSHGSGPGLSTTRLRIEDAPTPPSPTARLSSSTIIRPPCRLLWAAPRPVAPAWVIARGPTSHPASSSLPGTACMGSRNGRSSLHTLPAPLVAAHLPRDQPPAPRGPAWSFATPSLLSRQPGLRSSGPAPVNLRSQITSACSGTLLCVSRIPRSWSPPTGHQQPLSLHQRISCASPVFLNPCISSVSLSATSQGRTFRKHSMSLCRILLSLAHATPPSGPQPKEMDAGRK